MKTANIEVVFYMVFSYAYVLWFSYRLIIWLEDFLQFFLNFFFKSLFVLADLWQRSQTSMCQRCA